MEISSVSQNRLSNDEKVAQIMNLKPKLPNNIAIQCFDLEYYQSLSPIAQTLFLKCLDSGRENEDSYMGCYANNPNDYETFKPFFKKALQIYHKVNLDEKKHVNNWDIKGFTGITEGGVLDLSLLGLPPLSMRFRVGRNLNKFPLPASMSQADRTNLELEMCTVFEKLIADAQYGGEYVSITPGHKNFIDSARYQQLVDSNIMFKDMSSDPYLNSAGISNHWPYGRGCYMSHDKEFIIWVGEEDHLRIICMHKGVFLNKVFDRLKIVVDLVEKMISGGTAYHPEFGVVTSCPTNIGTAMRASVHIPLPNLVADGTDAKAKAIAKPLGLSVRGKGGEHTPTGKDGTVDISPSARFAISEAEIITALYLGLKNLTAAEAAAAATSLHHSAVAQAPINLPPGPHKGSVAPPAPAVAPPPPASAQPPGPPAHKESVAPPAPAVAPASAQPPGPSSHKGSVAPPAPAVAPPPPALAGPPLQNNSIAPSAPAHKGSIAPPAPGRTSHKGPVAAPAHKGSVAPTAP